MKTMNYSELSEEISNWLRDYAKANNQEGFVIGVSGGVDSAVVSTLCARTNLRLLVIEMPIHQNENEVDRAKKHISWLKSNYPNVSSIEVNLSDAYDTLYKAYSTEPFTPVSKEQFDFSMANTRSRLRMTTLYQFAGMHRLLVAGTGNKVEDFGVYFYTKWGDGGVDISPIGDLMKSEVRKLGVELGLLGELVNAVPTDGLHDDKRTDEEQLKCTYDELEWAMKHIECTTPTQIFDGITERQVEVLKIYNKKQKEGSHKSNPIPIFNTNHLR
jgi:NAD+ synthase